MPCRQWKLQCPIFCNLDCFFGPSFPIHEYHGNDGFFLLFGDKRIFWKLVRIWNNRKGNTGRFNSPKIKGKRNVFTGLKFAAMKKLFKLMIKTYKFHPHWFEGAPAVPEKATHMCELSLTASKWNIPLRCRRRREKVGPADILQHDYRWHNPKIGENQKWKFSFFSRK